MVAGSFFLSFVLGGGGRLEYGTQNMATLISSRIHIQSDLVNPCSFLIRAPFNQRPWYMSSLVYATGNIKDPVPLIEKRRGLSPGGRFPPIVLYVLALKMALDADRA